MFFFEKKNQKTFPDLATPCKRNGTPGDTAKEQKFFASFFQKRRPSLVYSLTASRQAAAFQQ
jgi:hypothetical protein